jgi:CheY-like chemotaxis protein
MDGITAATEIQSRWHIPIVFVTANEIETVLERAKEANPVGF